MSDLDICPWCGEDTEGNWDAHAEECEPFAREQAMGAQDDWDLDPNSGK